MTPAMTPAITRGLLIAAPASWHRQDHGHAGASGARFCGIRDGWWCNALQDPARITSTRPSTAAASGREIPEPRHLGDDRRPEMLAGLDRRMGQGADLVLAEGSMGLFDGVAVERGHRATASGGGPCSADGLAGGAGAGLPPDRRRRRRRWRSGLMRASAPAFTVAGVILNRIASPRVMRRWCGHGMKEAGLPRASAALPKQAAIAMPERHLGLVQAEEQPALAGADLRCGCGHHAPTGSIWTGLLMLPLPLGQPLTLTMGQAAAQDHTARPTHRACAKTPRLQLYLYPHLLQGWRAAGADGAALLAPWPIRCPIASADVLLAPRWLPGAACGPPSPRPTPASAPGCRAFAQDEARSTANAADTWPWARA